MIIVGAGLAGLISANVFPQARIVETAGRDKLDHKALLRFRTSVVADATGIEFRKVKVHKGLWHNGTFVQPNIQLANMYSRKVIGALADRSIWNLDASDRYIAPEDFISQMIDNCGRRIRWEEQFDFTRGQYSCPIISTAPMSIVAKQIGATDAPEFLHQNIFVKRFRIPRADVYQTIYFADEDTPVYRASITGNMLIVEGVSTITDAAVADVLHAFALCACDEIETTHHSFGKIAAIDDAWRKNFILRLSMDRGIYSVGRFATWRNILLDDVVHDLSVVKRLIKMGHYQHVKEAS